MLMYRWYDQNHFAARPSYTLSILAPIFGLAGIDIRGVRRHFLEKTPVIWIAGHMLFMAVGIEGCSSLRSGLRCTAFCAKQEVVGAREE